MNAQLNEARARLSAGKRAANIQGVDRGGAAHHLAPPPSPPPADPLAIGTLCKIVYCTVDAGRYPGSGKKLLEAAKDESGKLCSSFPPCPIP